jgi:Fe-S cluster assembly protein SufB
MTDWPEAFRAWEQMIERNGQCKLHQPDFQATSYYSAPKAVDPNKTLDDVDPELLEMYKKLGISVDEQKMMNNSSHGYRSRFCFCCNYFQENIRRKGIIL